MKDWDVISRALKGVKGGEGKSSSLFRFDVLRDSKVLQSVVDTQSLNRETENKEQISELRKALTYELLMP